VAGEAGPRSKKKEGERNMRSLLIPDLAREFDELFSSMFSAPARDSRLPSVESYAKDGRLELRMDLPGVDPKDVEISLDGTQLVIRGERKSEREETNGYREMWYGKFERRFAVPKGIDAEKAVARYQNGVLALTLPLPEAAKAKRISVVTAPAAEEKKAA
jgi:HSP20 family protein